MEDGRHDEDHILAFRIRTAEIVARVYGAEVLEKLIESVERWCDEFIREYPVHHLWRDVFQIDVRSDRAAVDALILRITQRFTQVWTVWAGGDAIPLYCVPMFAILPIQSGEGPSGEVVLRALAASQREAMPVLYDEKRDHTERDRAYLKIELARCIHENMMGFTINYQPIVDPKTEQWMGVEALCRWMHPQYGAVPPSVFIAFAEEERLIDRIDDWMLKQAILELQSIGLTEIDGFFLSVNVSPIQLLDKSFFMRGYTIMQELDFPTRKLNLEVTETEDLIYTLDVQNTFRELIRHGISISIDDFGTGYSSLSNLKQLPVSKVKTDCDCITDVDTDSDAESMYGHVVRLVKQNDITLIAEGVETEAQLSVARQNGVDLIQGYYYSKPMPCARLRENAQRFQPIAP